MWTKIPKPSTATGTLWGTTTLPWQLALPWQDPSSGWQKIDKPN